MSQAAPFERSLTEDEVQELDSFFVRALELLPLRPGEVDIDDARVAVLATSTSALVDTVRSGARIEGLPPLSELATALGVLWGDELCRLADWEWVYLYFENSLEGPAIVSSSRSHACLPVHLVYELLTNLRRENDLGVIFNLIRFAELPDAPRGSYLVMG